MICLSVRFYDNSYKVILKDGTQFSYSLNKYGKYAEKMAKYSDDKEIKIFNWFEEKDDYYIIYIKNTSCKDINSEDFILECYIDKDDFNIIKNYYWGAYKVKNEFYAQTFKNRNDRIYMHRLIMKPDKDLCVDHINGNGLNNRKSNLKIVTKSQNSSKRIHAQNNNTFGINGLKYINDKKDIQVTWIDADGKRKSKSFRISKYGGLNETLKIAKEYRESKLSESSNYIKNEGSFHNEK